MSQMSLGVSFQKQAMLLFNSQLTVNQTFLIFNIKQNDNTDKTVRINIRIFLCTFSITFYKKKLHIAALNNSSPKN